ncbi:hypothetical protein AVEN_179722-1 [Araneus ventricosus]|uniref:Uncharacterized protein n=1 Tax=Araneus ventricosus TaxID=182803 RepID=A0A4Y2VQL3_ARAVE|nr:hypothetical protein AVEN_179722-1 [Araneus ventricosus]
MAIQNSNLSSSFVNEVVKIVDDESIVLSNLKSVSDVYSWIEEYGRTSDTKWNLQSSKPSGTRNPHANFDENRTTHLVVIVYRTNLQTDGVLKGRVKTETLLCSVKLFLFLRKRIVSENEDTGRSFLLSNSS